MGLHYVGEVQIGSVARAIFDLITQGQVDWQAMPDVYDRLVFPDFIHDLRAGRENLIAGLIERFPHESSAIEQYAKDLDRASQWLTRYVITQTMTGLLWPLGRLIRRWGEKQALMTTGEYLDSHFTDEKLKAVLLGQWGLYGLPPHQSAFVGHALLVRHYMEGGYYPIGGSRRIAQSIVPIIEAHGGKVLKNHSVEEILIKNNRVMGVSAVAKKGRKTIEKRFLSPMVISDAGAHTTYTLLSFPSLKNPEAKGHTAEIIAFLDVDPFISWENKLWRQRGEEYEALKERIGDALVAFVEERFPGLAQRVCYRELGTPVTTEYFTNHRNGNIYGLPMVPEKFQVRWFSPRTPISGLYLTGSDAAFFGIVGAMMSGVLSTAVATGRPWKLPAIFTQAMKYSKALHQQVK